MFVPERINPRPLTASHQDDAILGSVETLACKSYRTANILDVSRSGLVAETDHEQITDEQLKKWSSRNCVNTPKATRFFPTAPPLISYWDRHWMPVSPRGWSMRFITRMVAGINDMP